MIDNQDQVERLLRSLTEAMPLPALASPPLISNLRGQSSAAKITPECKVAKAFYTGDEGGIVCQVIFDEDEAEQVFLWGAARLSETSGCGRIDRNRRYRDGNR